MPVTTAGSLSLLVVMLPWLAIMFQRKADETTSTSLWILVLALDVVWFAFVGWRACRLVRQFVKQRDRLYDRSEKYALPPEYVDTESATKARRRNVR
jgi:hypothetical protein